MDDIEIHLNKRINKENFKNYLFSENENEMLKKLKEKIGKYPKADLIIAKETDFDNPFLLCGEAKFFHYYVDIEKELKTDIEELKELKELGIAKEVALLIFDDYYHFRKSKKEKEIENMIKDANSKEIKVFYR
ncbi:MAG: hypothetical protein J7J36_03305, partial [Thermoplasmata archaeon]|nr:hypothetical protein [Thermoplasmata archaeon]